MVFMTGTIDLYVSCWFIYRVWILSQGNCTLVATLIIQAVSFEAMCTATTVKYATHPFFATYAKEQVFSDLALSLDFLSHLSNSISLCYYLRQISRRSTQTRSVTGALMFYIIQTGFLTALVCIACVILQALQPDNFIYVGVFFSLSNLYSNALLGSFNSRDWFRHQLSAEIPMLAFPKSPGHARVAVTGDIRTSPPKTPFEMAQPFSLGPGVEGQS